MEALVEVSSVKASVESLSEASLGVNSVESFHEKRPRKLLPRKFPLIPWKFHASREASTTFMKVSMETMEAFTKTADSAGVAARPD